MSGTAVHRPYVGVRTIQNRGNYSHVKMPAVFFSPIRLDVVRFVHTNVNKNARQAYGVSKIAGEQTSAESWGTGRAVARIPRVSGGGTHRSGQGAFGNMCRGGRMFSPNKAWRRWHRKVPVKQRRAAVCSALAASALPALVMARGHHINRIPEIPCVVSNEAFDGVVKTREAKRILSILRIYDDIQKSRLSRRIRAGVGKGRNRKYVIRRGPLVVYDKRSSLVRAMRNLPGVEFCHVDQLNILQLAPGGHVGRFIVWMKDAFSRLDELYGTLTTKAAKKDFVLPRAMCHNSDLQRVLKSTEIRSALREHRKNYHRAPRRNGLSNLRFRAKLDPFIVSRIRANRKLKAHPEVIRRRSKELLARKAKKARNEFSKLLLS